MAATSTFLNGLDGFSSSLGGVESPIAPGADGSSSTSKRSNALTAKLTSVLSSSYADPEIRDALRLLDERGVVQNDEDTRRNLKSNAQKEVIDCNARVVDDFGLVAEVCSNSLSPRRSYRVQEIDKNQILAIETRWCASHDIESDLHDDA